MSQTDGARLSGDLFDEVIVPLAEKRRATSGAEGAQPWKDAAVSSYFVRSDVGHMKPADFEFPGGGHAAGLIKSLETWWRTNGDTELADATPRLAAIAVALREEIVPDDGSVDIFCYTLF